MMTCHFCTAGKIEDYFDHEQDYYTKSLSNHDRWHGNLAASQGLSGEVSKGQFDFVVSEMSKNRSKDRVALDCTFSAPKSVSLAISKDEQTKNDMITAHQRAVKKCVDKIEMEYLQTRSNGQTYLSRNAIAAEFLHMTARPTEENNFMPDLDVHSHVAFFNTTYFDGKDLAQEYGKLMRAEKELGLIYRQELAQELQNMGYQLELTDEKQGFFELKGFDRETILEYSHRRKEILRTAEEHNLKTMEEANLYSRTSKELQRGSYIDIENQTRADLFDSGRIQIERSVVNDEGIDKHRDGRDFGRSEMHPSRDQATGFGSDGEAGGDQKNFGERRNLSDVPLCHLDDETTRRSLLLSKSAVNRLGQLQYRKVRSLALRRKGSLDRGRRITDITEKSIEALSREKFAFTVPELRQRIMAAGVLEGITREEAEKAIERARIVKLGRIEQNEKKTKDVYLTTQKNIETERAVIQRVRDGKGAIQDKILTVEESRAALQRVEAEAEAKGKTDFSIQGGEQAEAVHHILSCQDQYVCVDGLAGTGKTTMMERLKWISDEQGIEVKGVCFTGKAADGLQADSGIESTTIHSFLSKLEKDSGVEQPQPKDGEIRQEWDFSQVKKTENREIWAVDEAGLVDMHLMNQLQKAAEARGAQLLLLGDPKQLPPVGAGAPMEQMEKDGEMATAHLYDIRRQKKEFAELRQAVRESVDGDHLVTFEKLSEIDRDKNPEGNYREVKNTKQRREEITKEMTSTKLEDYGKNLLLVNTNADRRAYNKAIRAEYVKRGELEKGKEYIIEGNDGREEKRNFAKGDRIIFTKNDKEMGVKNGTMAEVTYTNGKHIGFAVYDKDKLIQTGEIDTEKYKAIDHAYAVTNYKSQGMTVDKVVVDMSTKGSSQTRNALYVDISRARENAIVYTDDKAKLERQTREFAKKVTGRDFARTLERMEREGGIRNNDRYHAPENGQEKLQKALREIEKHTLSYSWGTGGRSLESEQQRQKPQPDRERQPEQPNRVKEMGDDIRRIDRERAAARLASMDKAISGVKHEQAEKRRMEREKKIEAAKEKARSLIEKAKGRGETRAEREMPRARVRTPEPDLGLSR